jgi:hypothetical protein
MAKKDKVCYDTPNDKQTTLPTGDTGDKTQGSMKHPLPNKSKYK